MPRPIIDCPNCGTPVSTAKETPHCVFCGWTRGRKPVQTTRPSRKRPDDADAPGHQNPGYRAQGYGAGGHWAQRRSARYALYALPIVVSLGVWTYSSVRSRSLRAEAEERAAALAALAEARAQSAAGVVQPPQTVISGLREIGSAPSMGVRPAAQERGPSLVGWKMSRFLLSELNSEGKEGLFGLFTKGAEQSFAALDTRTGEVSWRHAPHFAERGDAATAHGVILTAGAHTIRAYEPETGTSLWTTETPMFGFLDALCVSTAGFLRYEHWRKQLDLASGRMVAEPKKSACKPLYNTASAGPNFDAAEADRRRLPRLPFSPSVELQPHRGAGTVVLGETGDAAWVAVIEEGRELWAQSIAGAEGGRSEVREHEPAAAVRRGRVVVQYDVRGKPHAKPDSVHLITLDLRSGEAVWDRAIGSAAGNGCSRCKLAVTTAGEVVMAGPEGYASAYDLGNGRKLWSTEPP